MTSILIWFACLPFYMVAKLIGLVAAPFVALFVSKDGYLPRWLRWFATPDSNMFGNPGDKGFHERNKNSNKWWVATKWQWRNTAQGFATWVLGVKEDELFICEYPNKHGYHKKALYRNMLVAWELKGQLKYPGMNKRFRWRIGWKLRWHSGLPAQYVFAISPFVNL